MKLGIEFPKKWREKNLEDGMPMSDILYGYAIEHLMYQLAKTTFAENIWIINEHVFGEKAYRKNVKERVGFYYVESPRHFHNLTPKAGDPLCKAVVELLAKELFTIEDAELVWDYQIEEHDNQYLIRIEGIYQDMRVPVLLHIERAPSLAQSPKKKVLSPAFSKQKECTYLSYSNENILAESLFEIMRKLELISDMSAYSIANQILKNQTVHGRHMMECLQTFAEQEPKVLTLKRLEQVKSYETYAYMKKKWQQYEKRQGRQPEEWSLVHRRLLSFLEPIWTAQCNNEIFFDDWMPELSRFLG